MTSRKRRVTVRRVYDPPVDDGVRILVDRVWPRGLSKDKARLDEWCKDVAPSTELRRWYGHDPHRFAEFRRRYHEELGEPGPRVALDHLRQVGRERPIVLLTATKDIDISQAAVLAELIAATGS